MDNDNFWVEMRKKYSAALLLIGCSAVVVFVAEAVWFLIIKPIGN